ncbi:hypothetical protein OUZ56_016394 [Daphnia magna]|uniref:HAT C-terminal dimerisation domain-containing protein n=1 Tax=Daphnia magna TaxID=35525 RepID=A0ABR0AQL0_9CRUS|nr:hypothetical protein OUZ56_016394 [Daphnia magna]
MTDSSSKSEQQLLKEEIEKELEEYFSYLDKNLNATDLTLSQEDPSHFWVQNSLRFPYLSKTAFDFLAIPATSASTERFFSEAGLSTDGNRGNIGPKLLESEACAKYNYRELFKDFQSNEMALIHHDNLGDPHRHNDHDGSDRLNYLPVHETGHDAQWKRNVSKETDPD